MLTLAGAAMAFVSGMISIKYLLKFLNRGPFKGFIVYRVGLATFAIIYYFITLV